MNHKDCLFCEFFFKKENLIFDSAYFFLRADNFPVNKGHALIISKRHLPDVFSLNNDEWKDLSLMIRKTKEHLDKKYQPHGYNIGVNCGEAAGQTIFHLHIHVIPRYAGDTENPRGGIRGIIPGKANY